MRYLILILLFALLSTRIYSQTGEVPVNECEGALNIFDNDSYTLQFTGKNSSVIENSYPSLTDKLTGNQLWVTYIATSDGVLNFDANISTGSIKMVIFSQEMNDVCGEISRGVAEIQRLFVSDNSANIGLSTERKNGYLYSLELLQGQKIQLVFCTEHKSKEQLNLDWNFIPNEIIAPETKVLNMCDDDFAPVITINVTDKESGIPLISNITVKGHKSVAAFYVCSQLMFNVTRRCKLFIDCEAEGYFFTQLEIDLNGTETKNIDISLEKVEAGKKMILEEIEFRAGTNEITEASESKLRRIKEFLALNSDLIIEIQGHVFATGKNSIASQKMSESRAKTIMKYLSDNGIDKNRMTAIGLGNTQPIYEEPKFSYEEQANRRVEIVIK